MKFGTNFREPARVVTHLNEGFTQIVLERFVGAGMAGDYAFQEIPTERIPAHLRSIGSRFLLVMNAIHPQAEDSVDEIRAALQQRISIEELSGE